MDIVIITGMSGAGKTAALDIFEDMGYYAIDNLPPALIGEFLKLLKADKINISKIALSIDIKSKKLYEELYDKYLYLKDIGENISILFLNADDKTLIRRYKELRRPHPLGERGDVISGIRKEKELLSEIKSNSTYIIDTSHLKLGELKGIISSISNAGKDVSNKIHISITSFGFKNGILIDGDVVMDVRFLPNPFYIEELKNKIGLDKEVKDYVFKFEETNIFIEKLIDLLEYLIPNYKKEGKTNLVVGIGCTGGKHRSVAIAEELSKRLSEKGELTYVSHRDSKLW